jgi:hypothetical protein
MTMSDGEEGTMLQADTLDQAAEMIRDAGYRFDALRSYGPEPDRPGYAFSVESDRACYGHPYMEVRVSE